MGASGSLRLVSADFEVGAATTVYPKAPTVNTPGVVTDAGRAADLTDESNVASATDIAPSSVAIVGRAGYYRAGSICGRRRRSAAPTDNELGAAAAVYPEAPTVDTPCTVANASGAADLADQAYVTRGSDVTPVSAAVIGRASNARRWPTVARLCG
ncbi:hypothetical protein RBB77_16580 [Tunturibacter psychrotolerans]|uniref:Uncharacterized protein n=1 Tax=Tunturiibacter psychrotolerans TaxID=3069686 RepID=A0AAU7ZLZ7_9BACT